MTRNSSPPASNPPAGGVLDFRQPGDPPDVPSAVWIARTEAYYRALWAARPPERRPGYRPPAQQAPAPVAGPPAARVEPPAGQDGDPGFSQDDLFR